jgi:hypothetical protein
MDAGYLMGAFVGGWIATQYGIRTTLAVAGTVFLIAAAASMVMVRGGSERRSILRPALLTVGVVASALALVRGTPLVAAFAAGSALTLVLVLIHSRIRQRRVVATNAVDLDARAIAGIQLAALREDGWTVLPEVALGDSTIDHVVVGHGGVLAVHSGWSPALERGISEAMREALLATALREVRDGARALTSELAAVGVPIDVHPVLFVHDPRTEADQGMRLIDDVVALVSNDARGWRQALRDAAPIPEAELVRAAVIEVVATSRDRTPTGRGEGAPDGTYAAWHKVPSPDAQST